MVWFDPRSWGVLVDGGGDGMTYPSILGDHAAERVVESFLIVLCVGDGGETCR